jgi:hypothetical protein
MDVLMKLVKFLPLQLLPTKAPFEVHNPKKYLHVSVLDPWDFGTDTDPNPRIRCQTLRTRIRLWIRIRPLSVKLK